MRHNGSFINKEEYSLRDLYTAKQTFEVNPTTGQDVSGAGTLALPFKTIGYALDTLPVKLRWPHVIHLQPGTHNISAGEQTLFYHKDYLYINGDHSYLSNPSQTVNVVLSNTQQLGLTFSVVGAAWVAHEHKGKLIRWTSGAPSGNTAIIIDNDATSLRVGHIGSSWSTTLPVAGNTFKFSDRQATLNMTSDIDWFDCKLYFTYLNITGNFTWFHNQSTQYFSRCNLKVKAMQGGGAEVAGLYFIGSWQQAIENGTFQRGSQFYMQAGATLDSGGYSASSNFKTLRGTLEGNFVGMTDLRLANGQALRTDYDVFTTRFLDCTKAWMDGSDLVGQSKFFIPASYGNVTGTTAFDISNGSEFYIHNGSSITNSAGQINVFTCTQGGSGKIQTIGKTTNNNPYPIINFEFPDNTTFHFRTNVVAQVSGGGNHIDTTIEVTGNRNTAVGSSISAIVPSYGPVNTIGGGSGVNYVLAGNVLAVQVTGLAGDINWTATMEFNRLKV